MIVTIQKPEYLPGLSYFDKIYKADLCIFLDDAPLSKRDTVSRAKILKHGDPEWISVSVKRSKRSSQLIKDAEIDDTIFWKKNHLKKLYHLYKGAPYFEETYPVLEEILSRPWVSLSGMNVELITKTASMLQLPCRFSHTSEYAVNACKTERLVGLVMAVKGSVYLCSEYERPYFEEAVVASHGIKVVYNDFQHPVYRQGENTFIPGLSIVDALFNCGKQAVHTFFEPLKLK